MDVLDSISCVFLFMAAGPFLEKLFLTSAPQNYLQRPRKKESAQDRSALAGCGKTRCEALIAKDDSIKRATAIQRRRLCRDSHSSSGWTLLGRDDGRLTGGNGRQQRPASAQHIVKPRAGHLRGEDGR